VFLLGWRFAVAEFFGGLLMIIILTGVFRAFLTRPMVEEARRKADRGALGRMKVTAEMDMSVTEGH